MELKVTVKVIRVENLLPPVDVDSGLLASLDELDRVWLKVSGFHHSTGGVCAEKTLTTSRDM